MARTSFHKLFQDLKVSQTKGFTEIAHAISDRPPYWDPVTNEKMEAIQKDISDLRDQVDLETIMEEIRDVRQQLNLQQDLAEIRDLKERNEWTIRYVEFMRSVIAITLHEPIRPIFNVISTAVMRLANPDDVDLMAGDEGQKKEFEECVKLLNRLPDPSPLVDEFKEALAEEPSRDMTVRFSRIERLQAILAKLWDELSKPQQPQ